MAKIFKEYFKIMKLIKTLKWVVAFVAVALTSNANAVPVTALDYSGGSGPGVAMEITAGGTFQTAGAAALSSFLNWATFLPVADAVGKVRISGVQLTGAAVSIFGMISQATTGGMVEALDAANNVLLSATFTNGVISLASSGAGSQFSVGLATFGGTLASYFIPTSATHSVSLINWSPVGLVMGNDQMSRIGASSGFGNGLIAGTEVPEPTTMLLLGSGILGAALKRKKVA